MYMVQMVSLGVGRRRCEFGNEHRQIEPGSCDAGRPGLKETTSTGSQCVDIFKSGELKLLGRVCIFFLFCMFWSHFELVKMSGFVFVVKEGR